jgi:hypothetical protein
MCCRLGFWEDGGMERFRACFGDLVDPRTGNAQRHDLLEILLIALAATLCGAETCVDMALFGQAKEPFLRRFLRLKGGIPSHDTFSRLFRLLDPAAFEASFGRFVAAFAAEVEDAEARGQIVAVDGKSARRSFDRRAERRPLHMVNAWAVEQRLVLGQRKVAGDGNEIGALFELLALLDLDGRIVTADAMHCQKATAQAILERGGHYCLALKRNQPALYDDVRPRLAPSADLGGRRGAARSTIPRPRSTTSTRPSTAITAASRRVAPGWSTTSAGWPNATTSPASPGSPK